MATCTNCGWETAPELIRHGLCLTCSEFERRTGHGRPPPHAPEHLHRGETWPGVSDPDVRALVAEGRLDF